MWMAARRSGSSAGRRVARDSRASIGRPQVFSINVVAWSRAEVLDVTGFPSGEGVAVGGNAPSVRSCASSVAAWGCRTAQSPGSWPEGGSAAPGPARNRGTAAGGHDAQLRRCSWRSGGALDGLGHRGAAHVEWCRSPRDLDGARVDGGQGGKVRQLVGELVPFTYCRSGVDHGRCRRGDQMGRSSGGEDGFRASAPAWGTGPERHGFLVLVGRTVVDQNACVLARGDEFDGAALGGFASPAGVGQGPDGVGPVRRRAREESCLAVMGLGFGVVACESAGEAGDDLGRGDVVERRCPARRGDGVVGGGDLPELEVVAEPADTDPLVG
ncbi:hypothetical protein ABH940_003452 [Streptacidiphilus sp. BW17]